MGLLEDDDSSKLATAASPGELNVKDISTGVGKNRGMLILFFSFFFFFICVLGGSFFLLDLLSMSTYFCAIFNISYLHTDNSDRAFYKELVKVIEASDVILEVLDARDPLGTRCVDMENLVMKAGPNKHLVLLLNKIGNLLLSLSLSHV